jgi:peptide chain release factor 1
MFEKLKGVEERFLEIEKQLSDPEIVNDRQAYQKLIRKHAELNKIVSAFKEYQKVLQGIEDSTELLQDSDPEIKNLAREELSALNQNKNRFEEDLKKLLLPRDPNDDKNVIVEIRAGTGGEEAALFAGDLFRMYTRYAETRKWQVEVMAQHLTGVGSGGLKKLSPWSMAKVLIANLNTRAVFIGFSGFRPPKPRGEFIPLRLPLPFCRRPKKSM